MRTLLAGLCLLAIGFVGGWEAATHFNVNNQTPLSEKNAKDSDLYTKNTTLDSSPPNTSAPSLPRMNEWFQKNQVDHFIRYLNENDSNPERYEHAIQQLNSFLSNTLQGGDWAKVTLWTEQLLRYDHTNPLWMDMAAEAYINSHQTLAALSTLFSAHELTLAEDRRHRLMIRIEQLLVDQLAIEKQKAPTHLSQNTPLMSLMELALEKQPYHPLFGLMMADIYESSGEWDQALLQLQLLPYNEEYQTEIVANKQRLESFIAEQNRIQQGIPLQRHGDQFIVTAVFNDQVELQLMIDTGASITALSSGAIQFLQQHTNIHADEQQVEVNTANGTITSSIYTIDRMQIGDWVQKDIYLLEVDLNSSDTDGLLGMDFLGQYAFSIDQDQDRLYLDLK